MNPLFLYKFIALKLLFFTSKNTDEIIFAIKNKILMINVESISELKQISTQAANLNMIAPISLRVNPDIEAGGNEKFLQERSKTNLVFPLKKRLMFMNLRQI